MSIFYISTALLFLLSFMFALWPLIKRILFNRTPLGLDSVERQSVNVALYRDHIAELERSLSQSTINQSQFNELKTELERNLLEDSQIAGVVQSSIDTHKLTYGLVYASVASVLLVFGGIFLYQMLGNADGWQLRGKLDLQARLERELAQSGRDNVLAQELDTLNHQLVIDIDRYTTRFPDDLDSKVLLARTAMGVGRYDKAIEVYQAIITQEPNAAQILAEMAQAVFLKANNQAIPIAVMLAERALSIQPRTPMALGLMGIANFQNQQYAKAIDYWQRAIRLYPPRSPSIAAFQNGIAQARTRLFAASDSQVNEARTQADVGEAQSVELKVAVSVAGSISVKPEYTVFIYARAWQGPKLPLAIARLSASQLPITLTLDNTMAMAPSMNLSSVKQVELIARLSPSGNAVPQTGDWEVSIGPIQTQQASSTVYPLVISQPVKQPVK